MTITGAKKVYSYCPHCQPCKRNVLELDEQTGKVTCPDCGEVVLPDAKMTETIRDVFGDASIVCVWPASPVGRRILVRLLDNGMSVTFTKEANIDKYERILQTQHRFKSEELFRHGVIHLVRPGTILAFGFKERQTRDIQESK